MRVNNIRTRQNTLSFQHTKQNQCLDINTEPKV